MNKLIMPILIIFIFFSAALGEVTSRLGTIRTAADIAAAGGALAADVNGTFLKLSKDNYLICPNDYNLTDAYNWLKSSDRNATMGTLSKTNRRLLIVTPGHHWTDNNVTPITITKSLRTSPNGASRELNIARIKFTSTHYFNVGDMVSISGVTDTSFNTSEPCVITGKGYSAPNYWFTFNQVGSDANSGAGTATLSLNNHTTSLILDTNFVDISSLSGHENDTWITSETGSGSPTIQQIANDVRVNGITIYKKGNLLGLGGDNTYDINCADNNNSIYTNLKSFSDSNISIYQFYGQSNLGGTWKDCDAGDYAWRVAAGKLFYPKMYDCNAGFSSFGGDTGLSITGSFYRCTASDASFSGCQSFSMSISSEAYFEDCKAGVDSFGLGSTAIVAGTFVRCTAGANSFGGRETSTYGIFRGTAIDCSADGNSFGMYSTDSNQSGTLIRCRVGSVANYAAGISGAKDSNATGVYKDCSPWVAMNKTASYKVYPFNNGGTYTNATATGPTTATMQPMYAGAHFTFLDANDTATVDPNIRPPVGGHFILPDGTAMDVNEGLINDDDKPNWLTVDYVDPNSAMVNYGHAWTQETL